MYICPNCKVEMPCKKNGVVAAWQGGNHVKRGDLYKCRKCDNQVLSISRDTMAYRLTEIEVQREKQDGAYLEMEG